MKAAEQGQLIFHFVKGEKTEAIARLIVFLVKCGDDEKAKRLASFFGE